MSQHHDFPRKAGYLIVVFGMLYLTMGALSTLGDNDLSELVGSGIGFLIVLLGLYLVVNVIHSFARQESP